MKMFPTQTVGQVFTHFHLHFFFFFFFNHYCGYTVISCLCRLSYQNASDKKRIVCTQSANNHFFKLSCSVNIRYI